MDDYIGPGIGQQGNQRNENRDVHQQRKITRQRRLPGELSNAGKPAQRLDRNASAEGNTHGDSGQRNHLRSRDGKHVPQQDSHLT